MIPLCNIHFHLGLPRTSLMLKIPGVCRKTYFFIVVVVVDAEAKAYLFCSIDTYRHPQSTYIVRNSRKKPF